MQDVTNSLKDGALDVCRQFLPIEDYSGKSEPFAKLDRTYDFQVSLDVIGDIKGKIIYCMDEDSAHKIVSGMMMGMDVSLKDEVGQSALKELGNMMAGSSCSHLGNQGLNCDISTPHMVTGSLPIVEPHKETPVFFIRVNGFKEFDILFSLTCENQKIA